MSVSQALRNQECFLLPFRVTREPVDTVLCGKRQGWVQSQPPFILVPGMSLLGSFQGWQPAERTDLVFLPSLTMQANLMSHMPVFLPGPFSHAPITGTGLTLKQTLPDNDSKQEQNLTPYVTHNSLRGALGLVLLGSLDSDKDLSLGTCACNHCAMLHTNTPLQTPRVPAYSDSCIGLAGKIFIDGHALGS